ncbi:hypothetical protein OUZ56_012738 [Daphnia magna]|uniref:Uncharacterized protein n=1 Tax=Daphnia magna TaxID=35525 RepID=A0ABQ9Z419_9CRUS|nr:hypothetical protein OUZ56_012738 [Daphnia magna]
MYTSHHPENEACHSNRWNVKAVQSPLHCRIFKIAGVRGLLNETAHSESTGSHLIGIKSENKRNGKCLNPPASCCTIASIQSSMRTTWCALNEKSISKLHCLLWCYIGVEMISINTRRLRKIPSENLGLMGSSMLPWLRTQHHEPRIIVIDKNKPMVPYEMEPIHTMMVQLTGKTNYL